MPVPYLVTSAGQKSLSLLDSPVKADRLGELIDLIEAETISGKQAKAVLDIMMGQYMAEEDEGAPTAAHATMTTTAAAGGGGGVPDSRGPGAIVEEKGWRQVQDDSMILVCIEDAVRRFPVEAHNFLSTGRKQFFGFLVGQAIAASKAPSSGGGGHGGGGNDGKGKGEANPRLVSAAMATYLENNKAKLLARAKNSQTAVDAR